MQAPGAVCNTGVLPDCNNGRARRPGRPGVRFGTMPRTAADPYAHGGVAAPESVQGDRDGMPAVVARLREQRIRTVVLAGCDTNGIMRGKRLRLEELGGVPDHGMGMCEAIWALLPDEREPVPAPGDHSGWFPGNGYPDVRAVPDPRTVRIVPWQEATALALCDFVGADGAPLAVSPRDVLRAVVRRARAMGFEPIVGAELELYVLRESAATARAKRPSQLEPLEGALRAYGVAAGAPHGGFADRLLDSLADLGLPVQGWNAEAGPGQIEINLRHAPALDAADHAFLLRAAVREIAGREGLLATFMPKLRSDWPGSSCHLHLSLDVGGAPVFHDGGATSGMSPIMRCFVAGAVAGMGEVSALMAPTPTAYRRFVPHSWAATTATWSFDNRSSGVRVVYDAAGIPRLEHRRPGGDANPYLAIAAALACGLHGIEHALDPPAPVCGDVYGPAGNDAPALPTTLRDATRLLAESDLARDWLGADFVGHFVALREAELGAQAAAVTDWELGRYIGVM
ncbi:MAG: glutamine synthetase [Solirubrobacteraceae bacterium]|nr:glutamine synthetase [Solirubrobacteraceae bacterium]